MKGTILVEKLARGTQIVYVPSHCSLDEKFSYPGGVQPGFVSSGPNNHGDYFCRYWQIKEGKIVYDLRTKANSECTPRDVMMIMDTVPQAEVEKAIKEWC